MQPLWISSSKRNSSANLNTHQHYYRESSLQNHDLNDVDECEHEHGGQQHTNHPRQRQHEHNPAASGPQASAQPHLAIFGTDLNAYAARHMAEYEAKKAKWAKCRGVSSRNNNNNKNNKIGGPIWRAPGFRGEAESGSWMLCDVIPVTVDAAAK